MIRLIAIFAAQIRNTINILKQTFKEFSHKKKKYVLATLTRTLGQGGVGRLRVRSNTQVSTLEMQYPMLYISNVSLHM